jgi:hypothetical protein
MWLLMAVEHPILAAVVARLPEPEPNLAAFGITFSLSIIIESPVIMLLTAGTALARDKQSYKRLLCFTHIMVAFLTALHLIIGLTPLYDIIVGSFMGVPSRILEASRSTFLLMVPWHAGVAYRRLWQGVLIRFRRTWVVPLAIIARLLTIALMLTAGLLTRRFRGADLGAIAISIGVTAGAITAYYFVRSTVREHLSQPVRGEESLSWRGLIGFYLPLAITPMINLVGRPVLVMGLSRAAQPMASLALWPVITGALFLGRSLAFSYQEVIVALMDEKLSFDRLRRFTFGLGFSLTLGFVVVSLTPATRILYGTIAGLSSELVSLAILPTVILSVVPGIDTLNSWGHGLLIHHKQTPVITRAVTLNILVLTTVMLGAGALLPVMPGTIIAAVALASAVAAQWGYLWKSSRKVGARPEKSREILAYPEELP